MQDYGVQLTEDNAEVVEKSTVVIIAVKPHVVPIVLRQVSHMVKSTHLFISIAAGISLKTLAEVRADHTQTLPPPPPPTTTTPTPPPRSVFCWRF